MQKGIVGSLQNATYFKSLVLSGLSSRVDNLEMQFSVHSWALIPVVPVVVCGANFSIWN